MQSTNRGPIFIGGLQKSGTSLVRAILGNHPRLFAGLETFWFDLVWTSGRGPAQFEGITKIAALYNKDAAESLSLAAASENAEAFLDAFLRSAAQGAGKSRWVEKTPGNIGQADRILGHWPDAQIIHVLRDPRDVFSSMIEAGKMTEAEQFVSYWKSVVPAGLRLAADDRLASHFCEISYETVVFDTVAATKALMAFLGEEWTEAMAMFAGQKEDFETVLKVTGKSSTTLRRLSQPMEKGRVGLWKDVLGASGEARLLGAAEKQGCAEDMRVAIKRARGA